MSPALAKKMRGEALTTGRLAMVQFSFQILLVDHKSILFFFCKRQKEIRTVQTGHGRSFLLRDSPELIPVNRCR